MYIVYVFICILEILARVQYLKKSCTGILKGVCGNVYEREKAICKAVTKGPTLQQAQFLITLKISKSLHLPACHSVLHCVGNYDQKPSPATMSQSCLKMSAPQNDRSLLQKIVSFIGLFCTRDM